VAHHNRFYYILDKKIRIIYFPDIGEVCDDAVEGAARELISVIPLSADPADTANPDVIVGVVGGQWTETLQGALFICLNIVLYHQTEEHLQKYRQILRDKGFVDSDIG